MNIEEKNIAIYDYAMEFLKDMMPKGNILGAYFEPEAKCDNLRDVYKRFIISAQNYQSMPNVIGFTKSKEREDGIRRVLHEYDLEYIKDLKVDDLNQQFRDKFNVTSADSKRNSWYKWSNAVIDSAKFLCEFKDYTEFDEFVNLFDFNVHTRMALPLLIGERISGMGFALACDMLKELGYVNYPKPDVHLKQVFKALGLSDGEPFDTFQAIVKMSDVCKVAKNDESITPYKVDKIFWLICSGRFYLSKPKEIKVSSKKIDFIEGAKKELSQYI